jgi:hypothetical protein
MFIVEYKGNPTMLYLNPSFLFNLHQGMVTNDHQYVTKMALCATMGGLWGRFQCNILNNLVFYKG